MFIDIHTHKTSQNHYTAIQNLTFDEAEIKFSSSDYGLFSVGFHPWYASDFSDLAFKKLEKWAADRRLFLIGECGLDKNSKTDYQTQLSIFTYQIELAEKAQKPLIIHCVGYYNELFELKKQIQPKQPWIIHGFRGKPELAQQAIKAGCSLSFGVLFNAESVQVTPIDKLFVETDESQLEIIEVYKQIAEIKNVAISELTAGEELLKRMNLK